MSQLRAVPQAKINFLFFQDIITSVMGILILVTLMLSLSLGSDSPAAQETDLEKKREELARIEAQNQAAQENRLNSLSLPSLPEVEAEIQALQNEATLTAARRRAAETNAATAARRLQEAISQGRAAADLERAVAAIESQLTNLTNLLAEARARTNALFVVPDAESSATGHRPVAIIVSADRIQIHQFDGTSSPEKSLTDNAAIRSILAELNPQRDLPVFFFKPTGAKWFLPCRDAARAGGFEVGYDAILEDQDLIFAKP